MLEKLEMHEIQDKQLLLDEMNETREAVNELEKRFSLHLKDPPMTNPPKGLRGSATKKGK